MHFDFITIGMIKPICNYGYSTRVGIKSVYLILQARSRTEVLHKPIDRVCEVNFLVFWVDSHIIQRVELATEVIIKYDYEHFSFPKRKERVDANLSCCMAFEGSSHTRKAVYRHLDLRQ